jgi:SAM-dependent methyltransferase
MDDYDLPSAQLLQQQAQWMAPARARVFRRVGIARRRKVLDLACGFGAVTEELARRCGGQVVALDLRKKVLATDAESFAGADRICGDALRLPFADGVFDLVFCQFTFLWIDAKAAIKEIRRVMQPQGALVAIEPDYGGMIEYPPEISTRELWIAALDRAGADPFIGRKLPGLLQCPGWSVEVNLLERLMPPSPGRFTLLRELPLTEEEKTAFTKIESADAALSEATRVVHLPIFIITVEKASGTNSEA